MSSETNKYLKFGSVTVLILCSLGYLAYTGVQDSKSYYVTIKELNGMGNDAYAKRLRVAGNVVPGSIKRSGTRVDFMLKENDLTLPVSYTGTEAPPDTFKDDSQALADGSLGLFPIRFRSRPDFDCQTPARVGVGYPQRRCLSRKGKLGQRPGARPAVQGIERHGVRVAHHPAEHGVQRGLHGRAPVTADNRGVQALQHARLALLHRERGEIRPVENAQNRRNIQFHPTVRLAHQGESGTAGLDGHCPGVRRFHGSVAASGLHVLRIGSHNMGDLDELYQGIVVHYGSRHSQSITVLMPCPASITAKALTMSSSLNLCVTKRSQGMSSRWTISSA